MRRLYEYAMTLGLTVEFTDLTHLNCNGDYIKERGLIRIQDGMMPRKTRHTFAHELGHATHGDVPSLLPHINRRQEDRADEWAAHFLIESAEFSASEERFNGHVESMAADLYVLKRTINAYKRTLNRYGDTIYANARMGAGQWDRKFEVA